MVSTKIVDIPGIGLVTLTKRAQSRNLRLSVRGGNVQVSLPRWTPFNAGISFAASHAAWIQTELTRQRQPAIESGQRVGKLHYVRFEQVLSGQSITNRVTGTEIIVRMQLGEHSSEPTAQKRAATACARALKREAERLLAPRLKSLADRYNLGYTSLSVKSLKRRWGSCDSHQAITLNLYLMELPWEYIDYVLLHELAHTKHMNHGPQFWKLLLQLCPSAKTLSKQLRRHQPALGNWQP